MKDPDLRRFEREDDKQCGNQTQQDNRKAFAIACRLAVVFSCFVNISDRRRNKEDGNVDPIGRFSDDAVVGVKQNGNEDQSSQNAFSLYAPKISLIEKEEAFKDGKEEHRPKEQLHVLPCRLVYPRERGDPRRFAKPIV